MMSRCFPKYRVFGANGTVNDLSRTVAVVKLMAAELLKPVPVTDVL